MTAFSGPALAEPDRSWVEQYRADNEALYPLAEQIFTMAANEINTRIDNDEKYKNLPADQRPYKTEPEMALLVMSIIFTYWNGDTSLRPTLEEMTSNLKFSEDFEDRLTLLYRLGGLYLDKNLDKIKK